MCSQDMYRHVSVEAYFQEKYDKMMTPEKLKEMRETHTSRLYRRLNDDQN